MLYLNVFFLQNYEVVGVEFQGVKMSHSTAIISVFFINLSFEMFYFKQFKTMLQNTVKLCSISHGMVHSLLWH